LTFSHFLRAGIAALGVVGAMAASGSTVGASNAEDLKPVDVVAVSGLLDHVVVHSIHEALARSERNGAQAIVLQVNSLGAVVDATRMQELLQEISDATVPVAVWVGPTGARTYGWSAQLLAVADVTAMAPGARVGYSGKLLAVDGEPVSFGAADATLRTSSMGFEEAREAGVLNYAGTDEGVPVVRNMLLALDGIEVDGILLDTVVETVDGSGQVVRDATTARFFKLDLMGQLMHTVASPPVAYLLFIIGLALLIFELFTAGVGIAGVVGATSLVLGTYGLAELPTRPVAVVLTLLAIFAFAIDVQVGIPRFWTGVGLLFFTVASFVMYEPIDGTDLRLSWLTLVSGISMVALAFIVGMPSMVRTRFATPTIGREWMIGMEGTAESAVSPEGVVVVKGAKWRARTNRATPIGHGEACKVVGIDGVTLEVEPLSGAARDYREMRKGSAD
jgi:membrane-bound serine protease (ClpP class)